MSSAEQANHANVQSTSEAEPLLAAAQGLRTLLRERSARIERERRLGTEVFQALYDLGAFNLQVSDRYGGCGADLATSLRVVEELSRADASCGWCAMVGTEGSSLVNALLAPGVVREMLVIPKRSVVAASVVGAGEAIPEGEGFVVSGRFRFASGCRHASWLGGFYTVMDGNEPRINAAGQPDRRLMFASVSEAEILDTWDTPGLRGTASDDFVLERVFIPAQRCATLLAEPADPATAWRIPVGLRLASSKAAAVTGTARGAMDALYALLENRVPFVGGRPAREEARVHMALAGAEATLEAGRAYLYQCVDEVWRRALRGDPIRSEDIARARLAIVHARRAAVGCVDQIQEVAGTSAIFSAALDRATRDLGVARHHMQLQPHVQEDVGRVLLGLAPRNPLF